MIILLFATMCNWTVDTTEPEDQIRNIFTKLKTKPRKRYFMYYGQIRILCT